MGRRATQLSLACAIVIIGIAAYVAVRPPATPALEETIPETRLHQAYVMQAEFFERAHAGESASLFEGEVIGGIIPHHLLASHLIARFFLGLADQNPSVVVVVGPNHYNTGHGSLISSEADWKTPYGVLKSDHDLIDRLLSEYGVSIDENVFIREHSISAEVAFIRRAFPETRLVPVVVKDGITLEKAVEFGNQLAQLLPDDALVLASVDFSHYRKAAEAMAEDDRSRPVLETLSVERLSEVAVDSRPSLAILFAFAQVRGVRQADILENENSATLVGDMKLPEVTSYFTAYLAL